MKKNPARKQQPNLKNPASTAEQAVKSDASQATNTMVAIVNDGSTVKNLTSLARATLPTIAPPESDPANDRPLVAGEIRLMLPEVCWIDDMKYRSQWDVTNCNRSHYPGMCILYCAFAGRKLKNGRTVNSTGMALQAFAECVHDQAMGADDAPCAIILPAPMAKVVKPVFSDHHLANFVTTLQSDGMRILYMRAHNRNKAPHTNSNGIPAIIKYFLLAIGGQLPADHSAPTAPTAPSV